ncbi:MAG TPA: ChaN family lipoprotein, partial [Fibrobacteria bacterium]|nr:ChaN family lipoprotein [Fibrobacteria bacterium]
MSKLRAQLLRIQRENYERNLRLVKSSLGSNRAVAKYGREYHRYLQTYQGISSKSELLRKVMSSDVVYHGDYHTLRHSQRSILVMLQELTGRRDIVLCLEMFHGRDQKWVDLYMAGGVDEITFLNKIGYARKWAYNWNPWRHILDYCKEQGIPVLGINTEAEDPNRSLIERDIYSAQIIGQAIIRNPGSLVYVVDGDYHVSPNHLPKEVDARLGPLGITAQRTIIYQNAENLYWKLAEERLEEADVLQIAADSFCLMNTVPATKLQSYLDWLEYAEDGYFPVRGNWAELSGENYFGQIQNITQNLDSLFQLRFQPENLERLTVYSSRNLDFTEMVQGTPALRGQMRRIKDKIRRGEGFLLEYPEGGKMSYLIYLPNSSINQAAEEATHFMHAVLRGPYEKPMAGFDSFYTNVLTEALGFFGSKMINEKRKAPTESSLRVFLGKVRQGWESPNQGETARVSRLLLQHLHLEKHCDRETDFRRKFESIFNERSASPRIFSTQLGYMLGNRLYYAVKKGQVPLRDIRALFFETFSTPGHAFATYSAFIRELKLIRIRSLGEIEEQNG